MPPDQRAPLGRPRVRWGIGDFVWVYFAGIAASIFLGQIGISITGDDPANVGGLTTTLLLVGQFGGWIAGLMLWAVGHAASVWAAKRDPLFVDVVRRHLRIPAHLTL